MGHLSTRNNPRRNPNYPPPPPVMGQVKLLRRGEPPTAFLDLKQPPPTNNNNNNNNNSNSKKKKKKKNIKIKKKVGFVNELYSTTCRIGPEPDMVSVNTALFDMSVLVSPPPTSLPMPLSLLRRAKI